MSLFPIELPGGLSSGPGSEDTKSTPSWLSNASFKATRVVGISSTKAKDASSGASAVGRSIDAAADTHADSGSSLSSDSDSDSPSDSSKSKKETKKTRKRHRTSKDAQDATAERDRSRKKSRSSSKHAKKDRRKDPSRGKDKEKKSKKRKQEDRMKILKIEMSLKKLKNATSIRKSTVDWLPTASVQGMDVDQVDTGAAGMPATGSIAAGVDSAAHAHTDSVMLDLQWDRVSDQDRHKAEQRLQQIIRSKQPGGDVSSDLPASSLQPSDTNVMASDQSTLLTAPTTSDLSNRSADRGSVEVIERQPPPSDQQARDPEKTFYLDTVGDTNNLLFQELYRLDIPRYRRLHQGSCLLGSTALSTSLPPPVLREMLRVRGPGQPLPFQSVNALLLEQTTELKYRRSGRYYSMKQQIMERDRTVKRVHIPTAKAAVADENRRDTSVPQANNMAPLNAVQGQADFVPLKAVASSEANASASNESASGSTISEEGKTFDEYVVDKTKEFNIRLRESPRDLRTWLEFVAFQDDSVLAHRKNVTAPIVEKKLSILEKALEQLPDSEPLLLAYAELMERHLAPSEALDKWNQMLREHPSSSALWKQYLTFRQSHFTLFTVTAARGAYSQAIRTLSAERESLFVNAARFMQDADRGFSSSTRSAELGSRVHDVEVSLADVVIRYCKFEAHSGNRDRAVAALQALLEYNLFRPRELAEASTTRLLQDFAEFWESDAPRIGDDGALTWGRWYHMQQQHRHNPAASSSSSYGPPSPRQGGTDAVSDSDDDDSSAASMPGLEPVKFSELYGDVEDVWRDEIGQWLSTEESSAQTQWSPLRQLPVSEGDAIETEVMNRMTLIEDVAPFLFDIKDPELLHVLVFQLLKLIGFDFSQPLKVGRADNGDGQPQLDCYGGAGPAAASLLMDGIIRAINAYSKVTSAARPAAGLAFNIVGSFGASMSAFAQDEAVSDSGDVQSLCGVSAISRPLGTSFHLPWIMQRRQPQEAVDVEQDGSSGDDVLAPSGRVDIAPSLSELTVWNFAQNVLHCALLVFSHSSAVKAAAISLSAQRPATLVPVGTQGKPDDAYSVSYKLAKQFLKVQSDNLRLWNIYARMEFFFNKTDAARKVYTTALSMFCAALNASAGTPASATATSVAACSLHTDMAFLFWSFAETELSLYDTQSTDAAARLAVRGPASVALILAATIDGQLPPIASLADQSLALPPATRLLKCRNGFEALLRRGSPSELSWRADLPAAVRNGPPSPPDLYPCMLPASARAYTAVCYVWLEYLCSGLDAALRVFNEHVFAYIRGPDEKEPTGRRSRWNESTQSQMADPRDAWVARGSLQHEWLLCMYVRLLVWHSSRFAMSPRLLRSSLRRAVQDFPNNTLFLSLLVSTDKHSHATLSLRRTFDSLLFDRVDKASASSASSMTRSGTTAWVYSIAFEISLASSGSDHRVRYLFERAVDGRGRLIPEIWRMYMHYNVSRGRSALADRDIQRASAYMMDAKKVYYRALHQCPFSKALFLDGLALLTFERMYRVVTTAVTVSVAPLKREEQTHIDTSWALGHSEIVGMLNLAMEKEIRLCVPPPS